jgi:hypothetical protein
MSQALHLSEGADALLSRVLCRPTTGGELRVDLFA